MNAQPFAAALEAGKVYIVLENPDDLQVTEADDHTGWVRDFFMEVEKFPEAEFDDQMDAISGTYKLLTGKVHFKASIGRKMGETRAKTAKIGGMSAALDEVHSSLRDETVTNTQGERKKQRGATFGRQFDRTNDIGRLGVG